MRWVLLSTSEDRRNPDEPCIFAVAGSRLRCRHRPRGHRTGQGPWGPDDAKSDLRQWSASGSSIRTAGAGDSGPVGDKDGGGFGKHKTPRMHTAGSPGGAWEAASAARCPLWAPPNLGLREWGTATSPDLARLENWGLGIKTTNVPREKNSTTGPNEMQLFCKPKAKKIKVFVLWFVRRHRARFRGSRQGRGVGRRELERGRVCSNVVGRADCRNETLAAERNP